MTPPSSISAPGERVPAVGQQLGSYELLALLGEGSMGRVYHARHVRLGREVALKVLREEHARNGALVVRFFEEARTVNRISHPNIVEVFDFVEDLDSGYVFCVMELLRGKSLAQRLGEGPLPLATVCHVARQLCSAVAAAHAVGVVHRDLKPDNLFLVERPEGQPDARVLDFGVAKLLTGPRTVSTLEGTLVGTPLYMAPEQAAGLETDRRTDIYAVGNILFELLTGRPPFPEQPFGQLMVQIITQQAPALPERTLGGEPIPTALRRLVMRCLEKEAERRPQSLEEVLAVLEGRLQLPPPASRSHLREHTRVAGLVTGLVGVAAACVAVAATVRPAPEPQPSAPRAELPVPLWMRGSGPLLEELPSPLLLTVPAVASSVQGQAGGAEATRALADEADTAHAVATSAHLRAAEVTLTVHSVPQGALVTRLDTGEFLGRTPLRRTLPASEDALVLRLSRRGHLPTQRRVRLSRDASLHVALRTQPKLAPQPPTLRTRDDVLDPFAP